MLSHSRPNILFVLFFGWFFLLIREAFAMRTDRCRDCGNLRRYKSDGSWFALAVLVLILVCIAITMMRKAQP